MESMAQHGESVPHPAAFALPPDGEAVYAAVLKSAPISIADLCAQTESPELVRRWLGQLAGLGLVWHDSSQLIHPSPPRAAAEAWAAERELEAAQARESAHRLTTRRMSFRTRSYWVPCETAWLPGKRQGSSPTYR